MQVMSIIKQVVKSHVIETGKFFCPKCAIYAVHERIGYRRWQTVLGVALYPVEEQRQVVKCLACYAEGKPHIPLDPRYWDARNRQQFTKYVLQSLVEIAREGGRVIHPSVWSYIREAYVHICGELPNEINLGDFIRSPAVCEPIEKLNLDKKTVKRFRQGQEMLRREFVKKPHATIDPNTHPAAVAQRAARAKSQREREAYSAYIRAKALEIFTQLPPSEQAIMEASLGAMRKQFAAALEKKSRFSLLEGILASVELPWKADLVRKAHKDKFMSFEQWKTAGQPQS
jgi:hypothetical protein